MSVLAIQAAAYFTAFMIAILRECFLSNAGTGI
jgi:hypothetical protein